VLRAESAMNRRSIESISPIVRTAVGEQVGSHTGRLGANQLVGDEASLSRTAKAVRDVGGFIPVVEEVELNVD